MSSWVSACAEANCVELASMDSGRVVTGFIGIRSTLTPQSSIVASVAEVEAFVKACKDGRFDVLVAGARARMDELTAGWQAAETSSEALADVDPDPRTETRQTPGSVEHSGRNEATAANTTPARDGDGIHPAITAALNAQHYEWYPEELNHPNVALRTDALVRLRETSEVTAAVLRWLVKNQPLDGVTLTRHLLTLADEIEATADQTKENR